MSITLTGKIVHPDGSVPTGSLLFTLAAKTESSGVVNVPLAGAVSIGALGAVSVALEAGQQYDVVAQLTGPRAGTYSLGRWTCPAAGVFTVPTLFDAFRATLTHPADHLRCFVRTLTQVEQTPSRGVGFALTPSGPEAYDAHGYRLVTGSLLDFPDGRNHFEAAAGTLLLKAYNDGWAGNDNASHTFLAGYEQAGTLAIYIAKVSDNSLYCFLGNGGSFKGKSLAVDGTSLPASGTVRLGMTWSAGVITARLNTTDLTTDYTTGGSGVPVDFLGQVNIGAAAAGADPLTGSLEALAIYDVALTPTELAAALAAL